jgi:hypothetical protein
MKLCLSFIIYQIFKFSYTAEYGLNNVDPEDIEDFLVKVETSFGIKFAERELAHVKTFGEMCDHLIDKIQLEDVNDCTTQQAFYKLREAMSAVTGLNRQSIHTDLPLQVAFPIKNRRTSIREVEQKLNIKLNLLRSPDWIFTTLVLLLVASLIGLFFKWQLGCLGLGISVSGFWLSAKLGTMFTMNTFGQLVQQLTRESYLKMRRNPATFNKEEIELLLTEWFEDDLGFDRSTLTRGATFV